MMKVDTNCWCKVLTQSSNANFHHHATCIRLRDDAKNKKLKFHHPTLSVHFVVFVFIICSSSHRSCLQLLYIYLFALFVVRSSSYKSFCTCALGLLVIINSFSHHCFHVYNCFAFNYLFVCCLFTFILSLCAFGFLIIVHSSSHHHLYIYSCFALSRLCSTSQIFTQTFYNNFLCSNFLHHLLCALFVIFGFHFCENSKSSSM